MEAFGNELTGCKSLLETTTRLSIHDQSRMVNMMEDGGQDEKREYEIQNMKYRLIFLSDYIITECDFVRFRSRTIKK